MKISVVIAAKNETKTIRNIVMESGKYSQEVLVIDGHSDDETVRLAEKAGARVFSDNQSGKGAALRKGIEKASGDIIVFLDADGSHSPKDIPRLVAPILAGECEHVTGSRMKGGSDELHGDIGKFIRMVGSDVITLGINYRFNVRLTDSQNGFRAILTETARKLELKEDITTIEQEMIIKTLKKGYRITEVPTHEFKRIYGDSRININKVAYRYVYSWLK
ncbi:MAG: glycosyltransferase family 2 protein, partial [Acidobacteriota bacterium]